MSEELPPILPPLPPLMSAVKARDIARSCQAMANHLREQGVESGIVRPLEQRSARLMVYAVALLGAHRGRVDP
jgi:hypothetical protein